MVMQLGTGMESVFCVHAGAKSNVLAVFDHLTSATCRVGSQINIVASCHASTLCQTSVIWQCVEAF